MKAWVSFPSRIVLLGLAVCIQGILRKGKDTPGGLGVHCKQPERRIYRILAKVSMSHTGKAKYVVSFPRVRIGKQVSHKTDIPLCTRDW